MPLPIPDIFGRTALVAGDTMMSLMADTRVLVVGVGGVGSWAVEALVRSGIGHITIVDSDTVAVSNINRQLPALTTTVGRRKVDVLAERMLQINPGLDICPVCDVYTPENADTYDLDAYDYIIDAIDTLRCKTELIQRACSSRAQFYSSMGAARKLHASRIATAEFRKVEGCPLARALRQRMRRDGTMPRRKFTCVYSPEVIPNRKSPDATAGTDGWSHAKASVNGTFAHTTAIFGFTLAGLVIEDLYNRTAKSTPEGQ
ncbi:MAG: tRNA threonylcarbamoyladenosine dehydratase [Bacteroidales bacterium]|nr:tRNA threonylcarbamoyladenosine dehydratase [Bacteroidales bacterium]